MAIQELPRLLQPQAVGRLEYPVDAAAASAGPPPVPAAHLDDVVPNAIPRQHVLLRRVGVGIVSGVGGQIEGPRGRIITVAEALRVLQTVQYRRDGCDRAIGLVYLGVEPTGIDEEVIERVFGQVAVRGFRGVVQQAKRGRGGVIEDVGGGGSGGAGGCGQAQHRRDAPFLLLRDDDGR